MFESDQVLTIGDIVRLKNFFERMKALEPWWHFKTHWQYDTALDIADLFYYWIQSGKPAVDFDTIFLNEKNKMKRRDER